MVGLKSEREEIRLGAWNLVEFERIIHRTTQIRSPGRKIDSISRQFLGTDYQEMTLIGDEKTTEKLVIDLSGVDCFTFLDYVESLRQSDSFAKFKDRLACIRYRSGVVAFDHRNHFFSDWVGSNNEFIEDITKQIGGPYTMSSRKTLNIKDDGTFYLSGIGSVERTIDYIPASAIGQTLLRKCRTGDYIGIYTEVSGLDVSHIGIFVRRKGITYLRHASSVYRKVLDQEFTDYMRDKPGFLVLRPKDKKNGR